ncbi:MAG: hypothetical protein HKN33_18825 [Pyrinomonadaceae bacterium]|nr:hypothetical protein [Pyrinomonadaceae bacterium]
MNNRELYELVTNELGKDIPEDQIPRLDKFLISLWQVAAQSGKRKPLITDMIEWVKHAYADKSVPHFDPQWMQRMVDFAESAYEEWENTILGQIKELHEIFEEISIDEIDDHYGREGWYNYRVPSYMSFAVAGTYGGDDDDEEEPYEVDQFSWQDFADFLEMGKSYN